MASFLKLPSEASKTLKQKGQCSNRNIRQSTGKGLMVGRVEVHHSALRFALETDAERKNANSLTPYLGR